ncbi:cysteine--tRNA ligase [Liquorilactobacillus hordei]|uniref:Cysteine--tRNA ligase n=1 Tax=Liquorilactobacillus hordei DSM 19519 TaxID=1423759 RepID=A0A0R1MRW9_9LACO|nr:cysteine--tRNA ligase [Liquorilactobacillus hordei]KRL06536.1 cysteinyl-tRNA synthetase [Liquorilactobacillus hordei DSM 19519]QYH51929.1 cysteine--tRNA ligase [Liquorilactobacillus hordei DSM 19519]
MIQLYNTLTNKKEVFTPLSAGNITMYVCGPTVYNYIHIGNARSAIAFDTIRRYFEYSGFRVNYVSNFTDVDDKIIAASKELKITPREVSDKYIKAFYEDTDALNIKRATLNPRVMDTMDDIIKFVQVLIDNGYAYESQGDVYYRARKFTKYGQLSGQSINELEQGASERLNGDEVQKKEDPLDFALWKSAKKGEIFWESPWGAGRPGWHIECSVMATKFLGDTIDIHAGGQDLEFPHHENEIAQSEAKTGKKFANYWLHNGFVTIGEEEEKMSKSLGNFITVHDIVKEINPQVLRFFMATTQYRRPIKYSQTNLKEAAANLKKLQGAYDNAAYRLKDAVEAQIGDESKKYLVQQKIDFKAAMDDDFNVQNAITVVYDLAKKLNIYSSEDYVLKSTLQEFMATLVEELNIFGVFLDAHKEADVNEKEIETLIAQRNEARKNHDFEKSDTIRDLLKEKGIILEDTAQGTRWKKDE